MTPCEEVEALLRKLIFTFLRHPVPVELIITSKYFSATPSPSLCWHIHKSVPVGYCKVTGRRHRVSPCRFAYFASPWWLLNLDLADVVEKQLYYSQSRDGIWRCGSRPSIFMIIPNTKRHPNNTKTDQLPIYEVITGLPRPYHNTRPPWWVAYAKLWEIRGNPSSPN